MRVPQPAGIQPAVYPGRSVAPAGRGFLGQYAQRIQLKQLGAIMQAKTILRAAMALLCTSAAFAVNAGNLGYSWSTVVNNGDLIPDTDKTFNSYNQPAVNAFGVVVFRARSRGGEGGGGGGGVGEAGPGQANQPEHGIFMRDMAHDRTPVRTVFTRGGVVPQPNNALYNGQLAQFNEFPSVPRIDAGSDTIATRAQSQPVWMFTLGNGTETRTGTAGVYTNPKGAATTAASMVGDVPGFDYFQVPIPEAGPGVGFDQFPGSPAVTERTIIVFKGNFVVGGGRTGIFYRDVAANRGVSPIEAIASSYTLIPGSETVRFGSTAPPSAAGKYVVFAGYDNEASPNAGGIYRAQIGNKPATLEKVVGIGDPVPGEPVGAEYRFRTFGEAVSLSSNGRHALFWGSWGSETLPITVTCPTEGKAKDYCIGKPQPTTVPKHQGFFVRDMQLGTTVAIAKTGDVFENFMYWNFSGRVPGMGEQGDDIEEPARWRSATFGAVSATGVPSVSAIKARTVGGRDGIYLREVLPSKVGDIVTLLETGMPGSAVDPDASGTTISAVGIERDGFRGQWLTVGVSMAGGTTAEGWAGIYAARFIGLE